MLAKNQINKITLSYNSCINFAKYVLYIFCGAVATTYLIKRTKHTSNDISITTVIDLFLIGVCLWIVFEVLINKCLFKNTMIPKQLSNSVGYLKYLHCQEYRKNINSFLYILHGYIISIIIFRVLYIITGYVSSIVFLGFTIAYFTYYRMAYR